eukprot:2322618-Pyramimonas_sp.AAC.1
MIFEPRCGTFRVTRAGSANFGWTNSQGGRIRPVDGRWREAAVQYLRGAVSYTHLTLPTILLV